jgi:hypothetical protein
MQPDPEPGKLSRGSLEMWLVLPVQGANFL